MIELMVAITILSLLLLLLASMVSFVNKSYVGITNKVTEFQRAHDGFESLTRRISQATLNPYIDYEDASNNTDSAYGGSSSTSTFLPTHYGRQSELRFIAGNIAPAGASSFAGSYDPNFGPTCNPPRPTHAIFFTAPLNITNTAANIKLNRLVNVCGYYIEYNKDPAVPSLLGTIAPRYRFRLMELDQPSENMSLYADETGTTSGAYTGHGWFTGPLTGADTDSGISIPQAACSYVLAENIVALIIMPRLSVGDEQNYIGQNGITSATVSSVLAPTYFYDSATVGASTLYSTTPLGNGYNLAGGTDSKNQLPPIVQVTMVAIDEPSAIRLSQQYGSNSAGLISTLYQNGALFKNSANFTQDLATFESILNSLHLTYSVFQNNVSINAARWSSLQTGS